MFLNQAKQQQSAKAKVDFLQLQSQIQNAAASPLAIKTSAEQVGVSYRGFRFGLLNLPSLVRDNATDPTLSLRDPTIFQREPLIDPDFVYNELLGRTPTVVDPFRPQSPIARLPGGGVTDPSPLESNELRAGLEAVQGGQIR